MADDDAGDDDVVPDDGGDARARLVRKAVRTLVDALGGDDPRLEERVLAWEQALDRDGPASCNRSRLAGWIAERRSG